MALEIADSEWLRHVSQAPVPLMWFLGAGASRSSGLPAANDITWSLKSLYYCAQENQDIQKHDSSNRAVQGRIQSYMDSRGFPPLWDPSEYTFYFELLFGNDHAAQQRYVQAALSRRQASTTVGHRALSALMKMGRCRAIFTTNFDDVVETTYAAMHGEPLTAFHLEGSYAATDALNADRFPLYVKLHGDFRYQSIKNLSADLVANDRQLQRCLVAAASRFGMVVSGYSGRDDNVMAMFREAIDQNNAFPHGLFWTAPRVDGIAPRVHELLDHAASKGIHARVVGNGTFDESLSRLWRTTPNRPKDLDAKVRTPQLAQVSIPLPSKGSTSPMLRTNALRIASLPKACGMLTTVGDPNMSEIRANAYEHRPDCTFSYNGSILFWGSNAQINKVVPAASVRNQTVLELEALTADVARNGKIKSFVEEAVAKAVTARPALKLRKQGRTWFAVVDHENSADDSLTPLKQALGFKGAMRPLNGAIRQPNKAHWAEAVSLRIEERGDSLWLMLRPDIWISPLTERMNATEFLRLQKLKRYNAQSFDVLSAWIGLLLGPPGADRTATVVAHAGSDFPAEFEISTRTAFSRRIANNAR